MTFKAGYRRGRHVVSALHAYSVFVTKRRRGTLDADMPACRQDAVRKVCGDFVALLREVNGYDDLHLPVQHPPQVPVSALVNILKGVPTRRLRWQFTGRMNQHIMHGHSWSSSYFAASCCGAPLRIIRRNIKQQRAPLHAISGLTLP